MRTQRIWMFIFAFIAEAAGQKITCGVTKRGSENYTQLTCNFPEDVGLTKRHIQIYRLNNSDGESTVLMDCKWLGGNSLCNKKKGVLFDGNFTNQISITVSTSFSHDIRDDVYKCQFLPLELNTTVPCKRFGDRGERTTCKLTKASQANYTKLTCYFPEEVCLTKRNVQVYRMNSVGGESTVLLDCRWSGDQPLCFTKSGIDFDSNMTKCITLEIPTVSSDDWKNDVYTCHFSGPDLFEAMPCTFIGQQDKLITASPFPFFDTSERNKGDNASGTEHKSNFFCTSCTGISLLSVIVKCYASISLCL